MATQHMLERYMPLKRPDAGPTQRKELVQNQDPEFRRWICQTFQVVDRSARNLPAPSEPCGMNCSTCRATRCCGACGLSKVGYLHTDCAVKPDIMKCNRCEQMKEGSFGRDFHHLSEKYEYLRSRRRLPDGTQLRAPAITYQASGYAQGVANQN